MLGAEQKGRVGLYARLCLWFPAEASRVLQTWRHACGANGIKLGYPSILPLRVVWTKYGWLSSMQSTRTAMWLPPPPQISLNLPLKKHQLQALSPKLASADFFGPISIHNVCSCFVSSGRGQPPAPNPPPPPDQPPPDKNMAVGLSGGWGDPCVAHNMGWNSRMFGLVDCRCLPRHPAAENSR